jgi:hypothetical protein
MESEITNHLVSKNVSNSSIDFYLRNIKRLNNNQDIKNLNFLKKTDIIDEKLQHYKPNTKRNYYISIVSVLKHHPKLKKAHDYYYKCMMDLNKQLKENKSKSDTQRENWKSQDDIMKILEELKSKIVIKNKNKITEQEYNNLLNYFILSLYTLQAPRRNLDYALNLIVKRYTDDCIPTFNYTDISASQFIFNNFKTSKKYKSQVVEFSDSFKQAFDLYFRYHPLRKLVGNISVFLLVDFEGKPFKPNTITKMLNRIFGEKIGVSMLRNIFLTSKYGNKSQELENDTLAMGTSIGTAINNYIKTDN